MGIFERFQSKHEEAAPLAVEAAGKWSPQSQKDTVERLQTIEQIERCDAFIRHFEKELARAEQVVSHQVGLTVRGEGQADCALDPWLKETLSESVKLERYKAQRASLQARLEALNNPPADQLTERQERQRRLAKLATMRLRLDRAIGEQLQAAQKLLNERAELTRSILQEAEGIGFTGGDDWIDQRRFEELSEQLPSDLAQRSAEWARWFFGEERSGREYIVSANFVALQETLAASNVFSKGARVRLSEAEAKRLRPSVALGPAAGVRGA